MAVLSRIITVTPAASPVLVSLGGRGFRLRPAVDGAPLTWPVTARVSCGGVTSDVLLWPHEWHALQEDADTAQLSVPAGGGAYQLDVGRGRDDVVLPVPAASERPSSLEVEDWTLASGSALAGLSHDFRRPSWARSLLVWVRQQQPGLAQRVGVAILDGDGSCPCPLGLVDGTSQTLPYPAAGQGYREILWLSAGHALEAHQGWLIVGDALRAKGMPFVGGLRVSFSAGDVGLSPLTIRAIWS